LGSHNALFSAKRKLSEVSQYQTVGEVSAESKNSGGMTYTFPHTSTEVSVIFPKENMVKCLIMIISFKNQIDVKASGVSFTT